MDGERIWRLKLAAWTHDPAEKALTLLRGPGSHKAGTVAKLREEIFGSSGLNEEEVSVVRLADRWAAGADRPSFPLEKGGGPFPQWGQVRFYEAPILIHPLSGEEYDLRDLYDVKKEWIERLSFSHFQKLIVRENGTVDMRKTFLAFWRLGQVSPDEQLGRLWDHLPADTRVPDHSIWEHLKLVSALAGCMGHDDEPVLLLVSFGPVQGFIAQARSTSDLWAGSHLLSRMSWEGMRVICERVGPDSVVFPDLRGVPFVDKWLAEEGVIVPPRPGQAGGRHAPELAELGRPTDSNPLFVAALPNRFVAIVPGSMARELALEVEKRVREWIREEAREAAAILLREAGEEPAASDVIEAQIDDQMSGFPEVYWSIVPWSLAGRGEAAEEQKLRAVAEHLFPPGGRCGFLDSDAWRILSREIEMEGIRFYKPNPGVLYPALYELLERVHAAAKSTRTFSQVRQEGYRCSLCGEREWLTTKRDLLHQPPGKRGDDSIWNRVTKDGRRFGKRGEHLCALCTLKRLWPRLFGNEVKDFIASLGTERQIRRFVVSTHTMALVPTMEDLAKAVAGGRLTQDQARDLEALAEYRKDVDGVSLPRRLARETKSLGDVPAGSAWRSIEEIVRTLPAVLDLLGSESARDRVSRTIREVSGKPVEHYYALLLMDGDQMGAWLSGAEKLAIPYLAIWHPSVRERLQELSEEAPEVAEYVRTARAPSPSRHVAISQALNAFALRIVPTVVEEVFAGKLLYAGGDDVMAMSSLRDVLGMALMLRCAYSGRMPLGDKEALWQLLSVRGLEIGGDYVRIGNDLLYRTMGHRATASTGIVVAHHTTPLTSVLRELRAAERRAKAAGRDAFSITLMKRAGGTIHWTCRWWIDQREGGKPALTGMGALLGLRELLARDLSRRAAYQAMAWLEGLGDDCPPDLLARMLSYELSRHRREEGSQADFEASLQRIVEGMVALAFRMHEGEASGQRPAGDGPVGFLRGLIGVAEFLAREGRVG
jgi:CRISPR-associated protein Cmr2